MLTHARLLVGVKFWTMWLKESPGIVRHYLLIPDDPLGPDGMIVFLCPGRWRSVYLAIRLYLTCPSSAAYIARKGLFHRGLQDSIRHRSGLSKMRHVVRSSTQKPK